MPYIIAEPCINVKDRSCVDVCPVDCIYEGPDMLYIHPDECIDCGACEPECRSEEHTSELQSRSDLVCRLLLEKKKKQKERKIGVQLKEFAPHRCHFFVLRHVLALQFRDLGFLRSATLLVHRRGARDSLHHGYL